MQVITAASRLAHVLAPTLTDRWGSVPETTEEAHGNPTLRLRRHAHSAVGIDRVGLEVQYAASRGSWP